MQTAELGSQPLECPKLARHVRNPPVGPAPCRVWVDSLPDQGPAVARILQQQPMQECGTAAWQTGDEDRALDRLLQDRVVLLFRSAELQQVPEESHDIPARRQATDQAERSFVNARR